MTKKVEPKRCPLCKSEPMFLIWTNGEHFIECSSTTCIAGPTRKTKLGAVKIWNCIAVKPARKK